MDQYIILRPEVIDNLKCFQFSLDQAWNVFFSPAPADELEKDGCVECDEGRSLRSAV